MCKNEFTGCVGVVGPASEVVLQQLVSPCGTGSSHQPHCGLMKKHLQVKTHTHTSEPVEYLQQKNIDPLAYGTPHKSYSTFSGASHASQRRR